MNYLKFVQAARLQDTRNLFAPCQIDLSFMPESMREFYKQYNPVDVEIVMGDLNSIRFYPAERLRELQKEYSCAEEAFVFASKEGDAVCLTKKGVYVSAHGHSPSNMEFLADSFDLFITQGGDVWG